MSGIKKTQRIKLKDEKLGAVQAPQAHIATKLYVSYARDKKERDVFIRQARKKAIENKSQNTDSGITGIARSCLGVGGVYLGIKYRKNLGYLKTNLVNLFKRKP